MALVGIKEGFNVGKRPFLNVRTGDVLQQMNLAYGAGTDIPAVSTKARGHIYSRSGPAETATSQVIQVTRNNTNVRGFHSGSIRIGFRKHDIEPPFEATDDARKGLNGVLFCYAQEVNDYPAGIAPADKTPSTLVPDPLVVNSDKVEGHFDLIFGINHFSDRIGFQLRCESRLPSFGGGKLGPNKADETRTLAVGDFIGIEFRWESDEVPDEVGGIIKPTVTLKGYTALLEDFSDATPIIANRHDFDHPPPAERTAFLNDQIRLWNLWGETGRIRDPLVEGASWDTNNGHGFVCEYLEIFSGV